MPSATTVRRVAAGAAAGAAVAGVGYALSRRQEDDRPDPAVQHGLGRLRGRERTITTRDGVGLHVEEFGPSDADLTVILAHGYTHHRHAWHYQAKHLAEDMSPPARVITYDHRGHGRSHRAPEGTATIEQLGRDLGEVVEQCAPSGRIVLAGHSMGGMTIMSFAEHHPDLIGDRVVGVALVGTSAARLDEVTHGLPAALVPVARWLVPRVNELRRRRAAAGKPLSAGSSAGTRHLLFGRDPLPSHVDFVHQLTAECHPETVADFYYTFSDHDRRAALATFHDIPVLIIGGGDDRLCPEDHSREMAEHLPHAELVIYPGSGHMVQFERAEDVNLRLARFVAGVTQQDAATSTPHRCRRASADERPGGGAGSSVARVESRPVGARPARHRRHRRPVPRLPAHARRRADRLARRAVRANPDVRRVLRGHHRPGVERQPREGDALPATWCCRS